MRAIVLAALLVASPAAAKPVAKPAAAAKVDWINSYVATAEGGYLRGNPRARVKIIEYASLTCPHCKAFARESAVAMEQKYLPSGNVSIEYRSFLLDPFDLTAALLVHCLDTKRATALIDRLYTQQDVWVTPYRTISEDDGKRISALPPESQPGALADYGKLAAFAGVTPAEAARCYAKPATEPLLAARKTAMEVYKIDGTPGFLINGVHQAGIANWAGLQPLVEAALKK